MLVVDKPGAAFSKDLLGKDKNISDMAPVKILEALSVAPDFEYGAKETK